MIFSGSIEICSFSNFVFCGLIFGLIQFTFVYNKENSNIEQRKYKSHDNCRGLLISEMDFNYQIPQLDFQLPGSLWMCVQNGRQIMLSIVKQAIAGKERMNIATKW